MHSDTNRPLAYGIKQAVEATSVGRSLIYQEIRAGNIKVFKIGARTLIAADDLKSWLDTYRFAT